MQSPMNVETTCKPLNLKPLILNAHPIEPPNAPRIPSAQIARDGTFELTSLPAGTLRLSFENVAEPFYIKSAQQGTIDVLKDGITLPSKVSTTLLVSIARDGGQITGTIRAVDGSHEPAEVVLIPQGAGLLRSDLYKTAESDANGEFQIRGVAPGPYEIFAWSAEDVSRRDYFDPEFMKHVQGRGTPVQMGGHGQGNVTLSLLQ
jgi:hypothetical protein